MGDVALSLGPGYRHAADAQPTARQPTRQPLAIVCSGVASRRGMAAQAKTTRAQAAPITKKSEPVG